MRPVALALMLSVTAAAVAAAGWGVLKWRRHEAGAANLRLRVAQRLAPDPRSAVPCAELAARRPLVLLALGQSNAGNHGEPGTSAMVDVFTEAGSCHRAADPLPGGTGRGGSIWSHLPAALAERGLARPVVLAVLAVDASSVREWTDPASPIAPLLSTTAKNLRAAGLTPSLVLWQQGESDAKLGTPPAEYRRGLETLAARLAAEGVGAPVLLARSTVCRSQPSSALRQTIDALVASDSRFAPGPDTDTLASATERSDGCHFAAAGLRSAAGLWARSIQRLQP